MPFEVLENNDGARVEGVTVHEFLSIEAAKAWYYSDAYRQIRENHRFKGRPARGTGIGCARGSDAADQEADRLPTRPMSGY
jgi:hypothetical protein